MASCQCLLRSAKTYTVQLVIKRNFTQVRKRFYKNVTVAGSDGNFEVALDQRKLKTPGGKTFSVPSYPLALAVAHEWMSVKDKIVASRMHMTGLSNTVLDNPNHLSKWDVVNKTLEYLETDTLLFHAEESAPAELHESLSKNWSPELSWFNERFSTDLESTADLLTPPISDSSVQQLRNYLLSHNIWAVHGFLYGVEVLKSIVLTLAAAERRLTVERAVSLARLETEFQVNLWGSVEWHHDMEYNDALSRFSAALLFVHLNSAHYSNKQKDKAALNV